MMYHFPATWQRVWAVSPEELAGAVPSLGTEPGHPQAEGHPHSLQALKSPLGPLSWSWVTAFTWV